ncbi:tropomyosin, putative [Perkinsus marinus ATCC 50983]|uniref:Tropomyosin, putative n=1 Tax=Perkinsus marinus (strain ATCC 50983 / TXsc) TaxID=423536 RepID=C5L6G1_PERM5|nr:tropomyosin, putative [Perkinsus marinus ATCC 50983]EER07622.1 tropomyosin, putative [Perkinsus marinus ATCC 50983]|eukprot:XP_002775806.1 tropomyosin, putative [Perkinsus marinus ATCC 50983]
MRHTIAVHEQEIDSQKKANATLHETVSNLQRELSESEDHNRHLKQKLEESYRKERDKSYEVEMLEADLQRVTQDLATHLAEASALHTQIEELSSLAEKAQKSQEKEQRLVSLLCRNRVLLLRAQHRLASQTRRYTTFVEKIAELARGIGGANLGISVGLDELRTEVSSMRHQMMGATVNLQHSHKDETQVSEDNILSMSQRHAEEAATWQAERQQHLQSAVAWLAQKKVYENKLATWKEEKESLLKEINHL